MRINDAHIKSAAGLDPLVFPFIFRVPTSFVIGLSIPVKRR